MEAMGGGFDVSLPELHTGARRLHVDSQDVIRAGAAGVAAVELGTAACTGSLSAALARLGDQLSHFTAVMALATENAGRTLADNAARYESDDADAGASLSDVFPTSRPTASGGGR